MTSALPDEGVATTAQLLAIGANQCLYPEYEVSRALTVPVTALNTWCVESTLAFTPETGSSMATFENVSTAHTALGMLMTPITSATNMMVRCRPVNGPQ